ncbi:putative membrane protein [Propionispora sp. 2/2-37]|uniref:efflux RND transporter periplasmic adaptor subunit n=1 Tax=Propionispora sp. 2/2-37 TaxID=1677858 RepID=UPI0006BB91E8|nr:efflux RND transporter periplasmic adaptor subunit [Propionispora sp. 2/2-37]CUH94890.1 putative membrane protein [Propionispora sp. 2/2-37]
MDKKQAGKVFFGIAILVVIAGIVAVRSGLLTRSLPVKSPQSIQVKAMQVIQRDTPITYEFVGQVTSKNEVKIMSKVSGNIVAKMVNGGDVVYKGQPLFRIDNKQYKSAINSARATLNKSQATLNNTLQDLERYRKLAAVKGVAQQTVDAYVAQAEEEAATVEANRASLEEAEQDEQDTLILSPVDGRIDVNDMSVGGYVTAGSTTLATVSSLDPIWVQFSVSENEYLQFSRQNNNALSTNSTDNLQLILSDGSEYPLLGHVEQMDKGVDDTTGTITLKASFSNPQKFLMPGMFAKVTARKEVRRGALLVPQRAVKDLLDKTLVTVVKEDNTVESRAVTLGEKVGNMWVVEEGLTANDRIVVEGIDKIKQGTPLQIVMIGPDDLENPVEQ